MKGMDECEECAETNSHIGITRVTKSVKPNLTPLMERIVKLKRNNWSIVYWRLLPHSFSLSPPPPSLTAPTPHQTCAQVVRQMHNYLQLTYFSVEASLTSFFLLKANATNTTTTTNIINITTTATPTAIASYDPHGSCGSPILKSHHAKDIYIYI